MNYINTIIILSFGLLLSVNLFAQQITEEEIEFRFTIIEENLNSENYELAIKNLNDLLKKQKNPKAYKLKADAITKHNEKFAFDTLIYNEAIKNYNEAIKLDPKYYDAHYAKGHLNFTYQFFDKAINNATTSFKYASNVYEGVESLNFRALIFTYVGNYDDAIKDYKDVIRLDPEYHMTYSNLAMLYANKGQNEKAKDLQLKAIELEPNELKYKNNLALILIDLGEYSKADSILTFCIESTETPDAFLFNNRGFAKMKIGDLESAEIDINNSISMLPSNSYAFRNLGLLNIEKRQIKDACKSFKEAINLNFTKTYGREVEDLMQIYCK